MQKKNNANDPDYVSSIFPHQNYRKASQSHTEDVSPHRRCVLNCHKRQKEKLGKSGNKTMQNYLSVDTTQMLIMSKK